MKALLIIGGAVAAAGIFLLATASADTTLFARHYPLLLGLNAALAGLLATLVAYQLIATVRRYRARVFGARLTLRLLVRFALLAVLPGLIVYAVSVHFLTRSIESWFDVKVDAALEGGITLGQQAIDQMMLDLQAKARAMAPELADRSASQLVAGLERMREQAGVEEAGVRRCCRGHQAVDPVGGAAREPGAGYASGRARRFLATDACDEPRRARRAHRVIQFDDPPAGGGAPRRRVKSAGPGSGEGSPGKHLGQPVGRSAGVRPRAPAVDPQPRRAGDSRRRA